MTKETLKKIATNPFSWIAGTLASLFAIDPTLVMGFAEATWLNLGSLFSFVSIAGLTIPKYWPASSTAEWLIIAVGIAFALKIAHKIYETYDKEI